MTNEQITYLVGAICALLVLAAFVWLIVLPAWHSYSRLWERMAAGFMTLYVLAALLLAGAAGGAAVIYFWDSITA